MDKPFKKLICFLLLVCTFSLCGCGEKTEVSDTVRPEKTGYIAAESDSSREEKIKDIIQNYLTSLEHHSQSELMACSADDLTLANDQTAFDDLTDELESAKLDKIYLDGVRVKGHLYIQARIWQRTEVYLRRENINEGSFLPLSFRVMIIR